MTIRHDYRRPRRARLACEFCLDEHQSDILSHAKSHVAHRGRLKLECQIHGVSAVLSEPDLPQHVGVPLLEALGLDEAGGQYAKGSDVNPLGELGKDVGQQVVDHRPLPDYVMRI